MVQVDLSKIKVVTVMPCYDKKLEAVRPDFNLIAYSKMDVPPKEIDTVLATHELVDLFLAKGINIKEVVPLEIEGNRGDTEMTPVQLQPLDQLF